MREKFKKGGYEGMLRENEYRRLSQKPFGRLTSKALFLFDWKRVPFYNIPDLEGFNLKPYVSFATPKVQDDVKVTPQLKLTPDLIKEIEERIAANALKEGLTT